MRLSGLAFPEAAWRLRPQSSASPTHARAPPPLARPRLCRRVSSALALPEEGPELLFRFHRA